MGLGWPVCMPERCGYVPQPEHGASVVWLMQYSQSPMQTTCQPQHGACVVQSSPDAKGKDSSGPIHVFHAAHARSRACSAHRVQAGPDSCIQVRGSKVWAAGCTPPAWLCTLALAHPGSLGPDPDKPHPVHGGARHLLSTRSCYSFLTHVKQTAIQYCLVFLE